MGECYGLNCVPIRLWAVAAPTVATTEVTPFSETKMVAVPIISESPAGSLSPFLEEQKNVCRGMSLFSSPIESEKSNSFYLFLSSTPGSISPGTMSSLLCVFCSH